MLHPPQPSAAPPEDAPAPCRIRVYSAPRRDPVTCVAPSTAKSTARQSAAERWPGAGTEHCEAICGIAVVTGTEHCEAICGTAVVTPSDIAEFTSTFSVEADIPSVVPADATTNDRRPAQWSCEIPYA